MTDNHKIKTDFDVYLIKSKWTLYRIDEYLRKYEGKVGNLRIVLDKNGNETDRTIALLSKDVYNSIYADKSNNDETGFQIYPFILKQSCFPSEYKTRNLFIQVPQIFTENMVIKNLNDKLDYIAEWNIIPNKSWSFNIPIKSREFGKIKGCCFLSFNDEVPIENISMVRILLTDSYWLDKNKQKNDILRCFWVIDKKKKYECSIHSLKLKKFNLLNNLTNTSLPDFTLKNVLKTP